MNKFHSVPVQKPAEILSGAGRENAVIRAVMLLVEQHMDVRILNAADEKVQQFPGVAAHRAGASEAMMTLHGAICRVVDGAETF